MIVVFEKEYLQELYVNGRTTSKKHRFQPDIVVRYVKVINTMKNQKDVTGLAKIGSLHYEHLKGDKRGYSSVRVNDQTTNTEWNLQRKLWLVRKLPLFVI